MTFEVSKCSPRKKVLMTSPPRSAAPQSCSIESIYDGDHDGAVGISVHLPFLSSKSSCYYSALIWSTDTLAAAVRNTVHSVYIIAQPGGTVVWEYSTYG